MKKKLSIQQRLIFPIILLGIVAFISNVLSVFNINNVNFNASKIVDNYMVGLETLQNIRHTTTNIHKMDYVKEMIDSFNSRTDRLRHSMIEIADSIESITKAIDGGAVEITGVADSTKSLVEDMADITGRMDTNQEIVEELKKQMEVFADF